MKNMLALSQERFSARKFTSEAVSQEDVDYIMECVRLAPSAVNRQPWHWLIVRSDEAKEKLQECYDREWFKTAPMYVVGMKNVNENWALAGSAIMIQTRCSSFSLAKVSRQ